MRTEVATMLMSVPDSEAEIRCILANSTTRPESISWLASSELPAGSGVSSVSLDPERVSSNSLEKRLGSEDLGVSTEVLWRNPGAQDGLGLLGWRGGP